ncbi:MAG TPA: hypothetical protein VLH84_01635 [Patescibacteria group bacterium]|nr:hypothetical protein [Patescibacteria group bacterium]
MPVIHDSVSDIKLATFAETAQATVPHYMGLLGRGFSIDLSAAVDLAPTPNKPNSARASSEIRYLGRAAGTATVIVFDVTEGSGDLNTFLMDQVDMGDFPHRTQYVPRSKAAVHTEAHFPLGAGRPGASNLSKYAGCLTLIELEAGKLVRGGYLGDNPEDFERLVDRGVGGYAGVTLTTGFSDRAAVDDGLAVHFGDPHAVVNETQTAQACMFVSVPSNPGSDGHFLIDAMQRLAFA